MKPSSHALRILPVLLFAAACDDGVEGNGGGAAATSASHATTGAGTGGPSSTGAGGDDPGPSRVTPPASNVTTIEVATLPELLAAFETATPGSVIALDPGADLDMTGLTEVVIPAYVTLDGGGGVNGEGGARVFTTQKDTPFLFVAGGPGVRVTGMRIIGPDPDIGTTAYADPISRGIKASEANGFRVDHSELSAFAHAAVYFHGTVRGRVDHNNIHHNRRYGLGYGTVLVRDAFATMEYNTYDANRHSIAGTGRPTVSYDAHHNFVGPTRNGHAFDMHGENEADDNGSPYAGTKMRFYDNTFVGSKIGVLIRGRPKVGAYFQRNCFAQSQASGTAIQQHYFTGNMFIGTNKYGQAAGTCHEGRGVSRATRSDVNGDQIADVVTLVDGTVYPFLGQADGTVVPAPPSFAGTMKTALFGGEGHLVIDVADVDGDLLSDIVSVTNDGTVHVRRGRPTGVFADDVTSLSGGFRVDLADPTSWEPIAVTDIGGDGRGDLVAIHDGTAFVFPGREDGTFGDPTERFEGTYDSATRDNEGHWAIDVADVNGDGRGDLVTLFDDGTAYVYPGTPEGTFGSSVDSFHGTMNPAWPDTEGHEILGVGDVNGDERADLVTLLTTTGEVFVYPGTTDATFTTGVPSLAGTVTSLFGAAGVEVIGVLDVTGDGRVDLVTVENDTLVVHLGQANLTFADGVPSVTGFLTARSGDRAYEPLNTRSFRRRLGCDPTGCLPMP